MGLKLNGIYGIFWIRSVNITLIIFYRANNDIMLTVNGSRRT